MTVFYIMFSNGAERWLAGRDEKEAIRRSGRDTSEVVRVQSLESFRR